MKLHELKPKSRKLADLIKRYPEIPEVVKLRKQGLTLQQIADQLNFTRERVRVTIAHYKRADEIRPTIKDINAWGSRIDQ